MPDPPENEAGSGANRRYERRSSYLFLHHFDFFGSEAIQRAEERILLSFLTSDLGSREAGSRSRVMICKITGEPSFVANFRSASQSFLPAVRSVIEKVVASTLYLG